MRIARFAARPLQSALLLCLALATLTGCQSLSTNPGSSARVRVIDLSPDSPAIDIYHKGEPLMHDLSYGTVTSYVAVSPGSHTFTANTAGSHQVLAALRGSLVAGSRYTVLVGSSLAEMQPTLLKDQIPASVDGAPLVRVINQTNRAEAVDVYLVPSGKKMTQVIPVAHGIAYGSHTDYESILSGSYTVVALPAGTSPTSSEFAAHSGAQIEYAKGSAHSLILIDAPSPSTGIHVIETLDAESIE